MANISSTFKSVLKQKYSSIQDTSVNHGNAQISADHNVENIDLSLTSSTSDNKVAIDSKISDLSSGKESFVAYQDLVKKELVNIDNIINKANQNNGLVNRYNTLSVLSKDGYGDSMQYAQGELKQAEIDLDNFIKANSSYDSYQDLLNTQKELEDLDQYCADMISYYDRQIKWQEYYKKYDSDECRNFSIEGMLGEKEYHDNISGSTFRGEEYTKLLEIQTIGDYDEKLKELFGDDYEKQFASYGLDFKFDYLKMYNYLYQTEGEAAAKEFYAFAEDNINSMAGLVGALSAVKDLKTNAEIMDAVTNYLQVHAKGMGDGVVGSLEGVVAWFSNNKSRSASSYETMWYSMMLETGKYGRGQIFNYQVGQGTGQMLPVMLIGCVCPESLMIGGMPVVKAATSGYLLMSSGGRDYKEQMINGKTREEAIIHGLLAGTTEVTTEHLLGGLPFLSDSNVHNLRTFFTAMGKEGTQEVIQDMISEFLLGEGIPNFSSEAERDAYWDQWAKEKLMTFAVAAFSAGELQGGNLAMSKINIRNINTQIDKGIVTEQELVDLIKEQYPTETMDLSNKEIIGEYNGQIAKYVELKLEALLHMTPETSSTTTEEATPTINNPIDMHASLDVSVNSKQIHIDENGVMTDSDGKVVGTSNQNPVVQEVLKKYDGSFDSKTRATSFKAITLDDGNSYGILRNNKVLDIEEFNNRAVIINKLSASGVNTPQLISFFTDGNYTYQIQSLAPGKEIFGDVGNRYQSFLSRSNQLKQLASLDSDTYLKFIEDFCTIRDSGLDFDAHLGNMLFDGDIISFIDLSIISDSENRQSNEKKISQVYNKLVQKVKNDYDYFAAYGLEEYLPSVDEQIEGFEIVKEKMISAYVEYMTSQGYDEQTISKKVNDLNKSEKGMISSFQTDKSLEKTIEAALDNKLQEFKFDKISQIKDISEIVCEENGTTIPDIDSLIRALNIEGITINDKVLTKDDLIIVPIDDDFYDIELSEDFISQIRQEITLKVQEERQLKMKELGISDFADITIGDKSTSVTDIRIGNNLDNTNDNNSVDPIQNSQEQMLMEKFAKEGFWDIIYDFDLYVNKSSALEAEVYLKYVFEKLRDFSSYTIINSDFFDIIRVMKNLQNIVNTSGANTNLSLDIAKKYLAEIKNIKSSYTKYIKGLFFDFIKNNGVEFKIDNDNHPIFLNLKPNSVYELKLSFSGGMVSFIVHTNSEGKGYSLFDIGANSDELTKNLEFYLRKFPSSTEFEGFDINESLSETVFDPNSSRHRILNNGVAFGVDQGIFTDPKALDTFNYARKEYFWNISRSPSRQKLDLYAKEIMIVRKYFPDLKTSTIIQYLSKIDSCGACSYASCLNLMIMEMFTNPELSKLIGNTANFKKVFGYDLYRLSPDGTYTLNQELLLADFYTFVNQDNQSFFRKESDGRTTFLDPKTFDSQLYVSHFDRINTDLLNDFFNSKIKDAGLNIKVNFQLENVATNYKDMSTPSTYCNSYKMDFPETCYSMLMDHLNKGENLQIVVSHSEAQKVYQMYKFNPETGVHNDLWDADDDFGHAMTITQVARDGIYVQSWGKSCFIPFDTLKECYFHIDNLTTTIESEVEL